MITTLFMLAALQDLSDALDRLGSQDREERNAARERLLDQAVQRELGLYRAAIEAVDRAQDADRALEDFERALELDPRERVARALDEYRRAVEVAPGDIPGAIERYERARSGIDLERARAAIRQMELARALQDATPGEAATVHMEETADGWVLTVNRGGRELYRAAIPRPELPDRFPPVEVRRGASVSSRSTTINGESHCVVEVDGDTVYDGPGSGVSTSVRNDNGDRFVEVVVDGRVVYRAGQRPADEPQDRR